MAGETSIHSEGGILHSENTPQANHRNSYSQLSNILLIRHAETVDNVRHNYAGTTNSPLTNHGVLQAEALATSLVRDHVHYITHIAASTLERAHQTATAIYKAARDAFDYPEEWCFTVTRCTELIERDFGSLERTSYLETPPQLKRKKVNPKSFYQKDTANSTSKIPPPFGPNERRYEATRSESHESLSRRANAFIDSYILPLIHGPQDSPITSSPHTITIAIVSHGILLSTLFRELVARFRIVTVSPEALKAGFTVGKTPRWDNTGYTHLQIQSELSVPEQLSSGTPKPPQACHKLDGELVVKEINVTRHLKGLKRTGGGIGSACADPKQRSIKDFLKSKTGSSKLAAGLKHNRGGGTWGLPPPPFLGPLPSPSSSFPDSPFRTDISADCFPSSPPPEGDGATGMYQVSDLF